MSFHTILTDASWQVGLLFLVLVFLVFIVGCLCGAAYAEGKVARRFDQHLYRLPSPTQNTRIMREHRRHQAARR